MKNYSYHLSKIIKKQILLLLCCVSIIVSSCKENDKKDTSSTISQDKNLFTITNLYDAIGNESDELIKDFGFSCLIEYQGKRILFDAGSNATIFKNNIEKLNIDLKTIDFAIVSHAHFDHMNGMDYLLEENPTIKIYLPKDILNFGHFPMSVTGGEAAVKDSLPLNTQYFDGKKTVFTIDHSGRFWNANIQIIEKNTEILPGIKLIATASPFIGYFFDYPNNDFLSENQSTTKNTNSKRIKLNELSLSLKSNQGEVIITGCSHSTVQTIAKETMKFTNNNVHLLYGGYHLIPYNREYLQKLGNHLKNELHIDKLAPAHCTGHLAFKILKDIYGDNYVYAGLGEKITLH